MKYNLKSMKCVKKFLNFTDLGGNLVIHLYAPHTRLQSKKVVP